MSIVSNWNDAEQTPVGHRLPKYTGGLGTRVTWGGFYADANFYFSGGNKICESWATGITYNLVTDLLYHTNGSCIN